MVPMWLQDTKFTATTTTTLSCLQCL